jgi:hypothetical protein
MALLDFALSLVGTSHQATPVTLASSTTNRAAGRVPTDGEPLECVAIDIPGNEARSMGLELPAKLRRLFFDPDEDGEPLNFDTSTTQLRVRGELLNILSVQRIETGSMTGTIVNAQVVNQ